MYEFLDKRYAQALYDVAKSKDKVNKYIQDLTAVVQVIDESAEFQQLIKHPEISLKEKKKFFIQLFKGKMDEDLLTFLLILIEKDRILFLREKLEELKKTDLDERGILVARIRTVQPLKDYQRTALRQKLMDRYQKQIELEETIDPDLIGGILIQVGDQLIDGSVRSMLDDLKKSMITTIEVNAE
ncbi:F0F1 ATP synthase subunit delta [Proteiniclasticum sp. QWL-01]|uniref:F0F1 ATP synthase subunit delta n=1 Tax=Proteiniclasticum sp. QWL-01 TaxID=3036945 RepID=UPI0024111755|nr:F0F1 ATP synthase subunit delta [Proteiniclasticum sp. QWL-01]WFF74082.1 F0F1 ATP synthase subunit delta [Proteiniclasticum sp. QWL-01]